MNAAGASPRPTGVAGGLQSSRLPSDGGDNAYFSKIILLLLKFSANCVILYLHKHF